MKKITEMKREEIEALSFQELENALGDNRHREAIAVAYGIEEGLDPTIFAKPQYIHLDIYSIIEGLQAGRDISKFIDQDLDVRKIVLLIEAAEAGINLDDVILNIKEEEFPNIMVEIRNILTGYKNYGVDVSNYLHKGFGKFPHSYVVIAEAIKKGIDPDIIAKPEYSAWTMGIVLDGLLKGRTVEEMKADEELEFFFRED